MSAITKLTEGAGRALTQGRAGAKAVAHSGVVQQGFMLAVLVALFIIIPLAIEHSPLGVRLGVMTVVLPLIAMWVMFTPVKNATNSSGGPSVEQFLRWGQYAALGIGVLWMRTILAN
jgi:hypothetical protein